jgi:hypothetical protein
MYKYTNIICLAIVTVLLLFSSFGCIGASDESPTMAQFNALNAVVVRLAGEEVAWNAYDTRIKTVENRPQVAATDLTDVNSRITALQNKAADNTTIANLQNAIVELQNKIKTTPYNSGYTPTSPGSTSPLQTTSISGGNGAVQICLQGYTQPLTTSTVAVNQSYFVTISSLSTVPQYFVPTVTIQPYSGQNNASGITAGVITGQYGTYALAFNPIPFATPTVLATTNAISGGYTGGAVYVGPGVPGLLVITITGIVSTVPANWTVSISGSSSNVY